VAYPRRRKRLRSVAFLETLPLVTKENRLIPSGAGKTLRVRFGERKNRPFSRTLSNNSRGNRCFLDNIKQTSACDPFFGDELMFFGHPEKIGVLKNRVFGRVFFF